MALRLAVTATLVGTAIVMVGAQQPPAQPPGAPAPGVPTQPSRLPPRATQPGEDPPKGSATLRGWVTDAATGNPVRRAFVRATSQDSRSSGMASTDADGRFEITELLGGRYMLSVQKAGYVSMTYGQRRPEQPGTVLEITDGTVVEKIAFALQRGGVITGMIADEFGDPVAGAGVVAMRLRYVNGARRLMPAGNSIGTDDRGVFRLYGLAPGEYYVTASMRSPQQMSMVSNVVSSTSDGYAPTYYPGTASPADASRVTVKAGEETGNVSMALIPARLSRITGRVVNSSGAPAMGMIMMRPVDRSTMFFTFMNTTQARPDGTFQLLGVVPGTYDVSVRPRGMPGPDAEFGNMRITVGQGDLDNLLIVTARGAIARGVITTDEGTAPPLRPEQVNVLARLAEPDTMTVSFGENKVNPDWTFEISGLSDSRRLTAGVMQDPEWTVKAVFHNGVDVTDRDVEFTPGRTMDGFEVVLSRKQTELSGQIADDRGVPETDATIIVYAQDPQRWGYLTRYVRTARPNQDGRYTLRGMPPHDYLVVAVKDLEPGQFQDPEYLESLRAHAVRISLGENDTKVQDLKVTRPQ